MRRGHRDLAPFRHHNAVTLPPAEQAADGAPLHLAPCLGDQSQNGTGHALFHRLRCQSTMRLFISPTRSPMTR